MPVLGLVRARDEEHGIEAAVTVTEHGGLGHTSAIYARDDAVISAYGKALRTGRILVNAPTAVGALGGVYNNLTPTFSLGCGTWGGSSTTENISYTQLMNVKTVSRRRTPPQWFRVPANTYFNAGALENLREIDARVRRHRDRRPERAPRRRRPAARQAAAQHVQVFAEVEPEPGEAVVRRGVELLERARPDLIVAVGGGSVIDAAKAMRLFYEHPEKSLEDLTLPFLDPRKRVADYPREAHTRPAGRRPDDRGHRLGGVAGGRDHRRATARRPSSTTAWSPRSRSSTRCCTCRCRPRSPRTAGSTR